MNRFCCLSLVCLSLAAALPAAGQEKKPDVYTNPADAGPDYAVQGEYKGDGYGAQVVAKGNDQFEVYLLQGGLPGAGWDEKGRIPLKAKRTDGVVTIQTPDWDGKIKDGRMDLSSAKIAADIPTLKKIERKSPTVGLKPPQGTVVLFDGTSPDQWGGGKIVEDNLLKSGTNSKDKFGVGKYHFEFRTPFQPKAGGQGRGNSGVYLMGKEIQVLDSFGLEGKNNECGAFYSQAKPLVNMCFPPLTWQTYDVGLKADDQGKVLATVFHNGVKVHDNYNIGSNAKSASSINLQDHGNPVVYRNIWYVPVKE